MRNFLIEKLGSMKRTVFWVAAAGMESERPRERQKKVHDYPFKWVSKWVGEGFTFFFADGHLWGAHTNNTIKSYSRVAAADQINGNFSRKLIISEWREEGKLIRTIDFI